MLTSATLALLESVACLCLVLLISWWLLVAAGQLDALHQNEDAARALCLRRRANRPPLRLPAWRLQQRFAWRRLIAALHREARCCARLSGATVPRAWPGPRRVTYPPHGSSTRALRLYARVRTHPLLCRLLLLRTRSSGRHMREAAAP